MTDGHSFLPRIQSVFYAVFDIQRGPQVVCQVPEGLIGLPPPGPSFSVTSTPSTDPPLTLADISRTSSASSLPLSPNSQNDMSPPKLSASTQRILFNFEDISQYVIPQSPLCGRLVVCSTKKHRIIGFPVELKNTEKYKDIRTYFRYNICFVFERGADLSCYEPIVRKLSRVMTSCEEESSFLSSQQSTASVHAILEQLYEDLNSYSETSIPIDRFNSIELKIFPFYPNPPTVTDWMVPLALINLTKRIEDNWDLTMVKVCKYIDGTNHVSRIAHLADCDIELTRQAISHLLYYQVIMTIDIFQYSNIYTLRKNIQWLADEPNVKEECGPYVAKLGASPPDWPKLLHLYSRFKPGSTVFDWMHTYDVHHESGIDVRRFTSFGVIKGFLRRVHRYPYLKKQDVSPTEGNEAQLPTRRRMRSFSGGMPLAQYTPPQTPMDSPYSPQSLLRGRTPAAPTSILSISSDLATPMATPPLRTPVIPMASPYRPRRPSAAEKVLETVRNRDRDLRSTPRTSWIQYPAEESLNIPGITATKSTPQESPPMMKTVGPPPKPRNSRSPSASGHSATPKSSLGGPYPPEFITFLDGEHHTDELAIRFGVGWPVLKSWLVAAGGGSDSGDFGNVHIIYR